MAAGRLAGQVAIVTGASSGIGLATARALAQEGATVVMVSRSLEKLESVKSSHSITNAVCKACNVVDANAVKSLVEGTIREFARLDIVANCAGVMYFTLMKNALFDQWKEMIDTNCMGTVNVSGAAMPHMLAMKRGHIVNISSDAARQVFPALAVYNASKAFVTTFSKSLRAECIGTGIRVTDIQPGDTATNLVMANTDKEAAEKIGVTIGEVIGKGADRMTYLDPEDVAAAVISSVTAPPHVGMHEILIEPRDQMFGDPTAVSTA